MNLPHLPPELLLIIFDFISRERDWKALKNCSIVSSACLGLTRRILFKTITLRLQGEPNSVLIRDVVRRIQGLCDFFEKNQEARTYVKTFQILDSYPVYDSQWITEQKSLPRLLNMLRYITHFTFGCEVGYLQWKMFSQELRSALIAIFHSPMLQSLSVCNLGLIPMVALNTSVRYLFLNNVTTSHSNPFVKDDVLLYYPPPVHVAKLWYVNVRSLSIQTTNSAWSVILSHADQLKLIKWRCWEDGHPNGASSFPGEMDLGKLPSLKKLCIRMSYGSSGRDLTGLCQMLDAISYPNNMRALELLILFPLQRHPHEATDVHGHAFWAMLASALLRIEYRTIRKVTMELTVHEKVYVQPNGTRINSVTEFRNLMKKPLQGLLNMPSLNFKYKVRGFGSEVHE